MAIARTKVAIIGIGNVGSALAHHLVIAGICDDLLLIDRQKDKAEAEAQDLRNSLGYFDRNMGIRSGDVSDCGDADVVVIAIRPEAREVNGRLALLRESEAAVRSVVAPVISSGFHGVFVVVTAPVDAMCYLTWRLSGLPAKRIIGTGTALDNAILRNYIAESILGVDPRSIETLIMGENGDSEVIPWSQITLGAKKVTDIVGDNGERFRDLRMDTACRKLREAAENIRLGKGSAGYGLSSMAARIIKAILRDEHKALAVSVYLGGEYGAENVFASVPAIIYAGGVGDLIELRLSQEEKEQLFASLSLLQEINLHLNV